MLTWIAVLLFIGVTLLAAGRLLALFGKTRELPELLIATLILGVGTLGVGAGVVVPALAFTGMLGTLLGFLPIVGVHVGMSALCFFTWLVYRNCSAVARAAAVTIVCLLGALLAHALLRGSIAAVDALPARPIAILNSLIYVAVMAWSSVEALAYWRSMRQRLALGLADASLTNRFLLWGLATGAPAQGIAIGAVATLGFGMAADEATWVTLCYAAHGSLSAVCFWLAFQPPEAYSRWIARNAPAA